MKDHAEISVRSHPTGSSNYGVVKFVIFNLSCYVSQMTQDGDIITIVPGTLI